MRYDKQALRDCLSCCTGCLVGLKFRVLFLEGAGAVMNSAATEAANKAKRGHACGSCCANPQLAVPECFIAKNWNNGWVSKVMFEAWADFGIEIVALTPANYSAETLAPSKGSLFERCIWEVRSGTVVNHSVDLTSFREIHFAFISNMSCIKGPLCWHLLGDAREEKPRPVHYST